MIKIRSPCDCQKVCRIWRNGLNQTKLFGGRVRLTNDRSVGPAEHRQCRGERRVRGQERGSVAVGALSGGGGDQSGSRAPAGRVTRPTLQTIPDWRMGDAVELSELWHSEIPGPKAQKIRKIRQRRSLGRIWLHGAWPKKSHERIGTKIWCPTVPEMVVKGRASWSGIGMGMGIRGRWASLAAQGPGRPPETGHGRQH